MSAVQTTAPVEAFTADVIRNAVVAITRAMKTNLMRTPYSSIIALVGFQGRRCVDGVQPDFCLSLLLQWSRQKSGGDSAISSEFVIAGMIFHPSRVQSELLHKDIEQAFV